MTYSKWYLFLLNTKPSHRVMLTTIVCVTVVGMWLFFLYLPLFHHVQHSTRDIVQRTKDVQVCQIAHSKCQKLQKDMASLEQEVDLDCASSDNSLQHNLAAIVREVGLAGLRLISLKKENQKEKTWYNSVHVSLAVSGSLSRIITFFEHLPQNVALVQCSNLMLQKELNNSVTTQCMLKLLIPKKRAFSKKALQL